MLWMRCGCEVDVNVKPTSHRIDDFYDIYTAPSFDPINTPLHTMHKEIDEPTNSMHQDDKPTDLQTYRQTDRQHGRTDGQTDVRTDRRADGRTDGRTDRRTDRQTDRQMQANRQVDRQA